MTFVLKHGVRANVPLLIGLAGGTGSGKTLSAMKLAKGLSGGKRFAVIDSENGRALAYADDFDFDHGEIHAPFRSTVYTDAITAVDSLNKYDVILVDSASHEHAGEGGMLDWQEQELNEMVQRALKRQGENRTEWELEQANNQRAWIKPKLAHKALMTKLTQLKSHLILCFRAEPKTEQVKEKDERGKSKTIIRAKQGLTGLNGWFPICEKNMPYELTASFLLMAEKPGVPMPIKLMEKHRPFFPADTPITEEAGRLIGEWARGGSVPASQSHAGTPSQATSTTTTGPKHGIAETDIPECDLCMLPLVWASRQPEDVLVCSRNDRHPESRVEITLSVIRKRIAERKRK